jgi:hypothetical protein
VSNLKMSDGKPAHSVVEMRSGKYIDENGIEHVQSMQYPCGKQKGVKQILIERGNKHKNDQCHVLNLQCNWCKGKVTNAERQKGIEEGYINRKCCMSYVLANEPDFLAQEEWLTQVVHVAGFEIIFYPKYHCELNYIEMIWGWAKGYHRRTCTYNYKDLKERLPKTFDDLLPLPFVRKVFQHCLRFMSGYRQNLEGPLLDYAMRKYTSPRTVPLGISEELEVEYDKYLKIKAEKK